MNEAVHARTTRALHAGARHLPPSAAWIAAGATSLAHPPSRRLFRRRDTCRGPVRQDATGAARPLDRPRQVQPGAPLGHSVSATPGAASAALPLTDRFGAEHEQVRAMQLPPPPTTDPTLAGRRMTPIETQ